MEDREGEALKKQARGGEIQSVGKGTWRGTLALRAIGSAPCPPPLERDTKGRLTGAPEGMTEHE